MTKHLWLPTKTSEEWNEDDHPRAEDGKFSAGGDGGGGSLLREKEKLVCTRWMTCARRPARP